MQKQLANKLSMYQAVQSILTGNTDKWEAIQAIANAIQAFEALLQAIDTCTSVTSDPKKGETAQKKELRMLLIGRTLEISAALSALIEQTNEQYVGTKLDYTQTKLVKLRDLQLVTTCESIVTQASRHIDLLAMARFTISDVEALKADIKAFADLLPRQRISVTERKVANAKLIDLFAQTDALLKNQLDRLMLRYKQNETQFYASYKTARHVINYGVRHTKGKNEEKVG